MARLRDLAAFAGIELLRAGALPRRWRGPYDGPQDFGRLIAFMALTVTLALLGWSSQKDAILKIHQSVLGVLNRPDAPIPIAVFASPDAGYQFSLKSLDAATADGTRLKALGTRAVVYRDGTMDGGGTLFLPGALAPADRDGVAGSSWYGRDGARFWALPTGSSYLAYYLGKNRSAVAAAIGRPGEVEDLDQVVILNRTLFRRSFDYAAYRRSLQAVGPDTDEKSRARIRDVAHLPESCPDGRGAEDGRPTEHCAGVLRNLVLRIDTRPGGLPEYHVFRAVWEDNLQTPVPVAALLPYGVIDQLAFVRELHKDRSERDDLTTLGRPGPDAPPVRLCTPGLLVVPNVRDVGSVLVDDLPPPLKRAFKRRFEPAGEEDGEPVSSTCPPGETFRCDLQAFREAVATFCGPRAATPRTEIKDDETLFVAEKPQAVLLEFPQEVELSRAVEAIRGSRDDRGQPLFLIRDDQGRAIARAGLLKTFQEESGRALVAAGLVLLVVLLLTTLHTMVDRRVRSYALLEMVGFSRGSIRLLLGGQVLVSAAVAFAIGAGAYAIIVEAANARFASGEAFRAAVENLGYDDRDLLKLLPLADLAVAFAVFAAVVLFWTLPILEWRGFGARSPLQALAARLRKGESRPPQLIENLTRSS